MKLLFFILLLLIGVEACQQAPQQTQEEHSQHIENQSIADTVKGSPKRMAMANIGQAHVHIAYNSPAVRKRIIWGGLVPFDEVWVTGAHNATSISFSENVSIAGKTIEKGKYAFFTIPHTTEWTLILNKNWEQHLTDEYSEKDDILRWKVKPDSTEHTERLKYEVISKGESGEVAICWEKIKVSFKIEAAK